MSGLAGGMREAEAAPLQDKAWSSGTTSSPRVYPTPPDKPQLLSTFLPSFNSIGDPAASHNYSAIFAQRQAARQASRSPQPSPRGASGQSPKKRTSASAWSELGEWEENASAAATTAGVDTAAATGGAAAGGTMEEEGGGAGGRMAGQDWRGAGQMASFNFSLANGSQEENGSSSPRQDDAASWNGGAQGGARQGQEQEWRRGFQNQGPALFMAKDKVQDSSSGSSLPPTDVTLTSGLSAPTRDSHPQNEASGAGAGARSGSGAGAGAGAAGGAGGELDGVSDERQTAPEGGGPSLVPASGDPNFSFKTSRNVAFLAQASLRDKARSPYQSPRLSPRSALRRDLEIADLASPTAVSEGPDSMEAPVSPRSPRFLSSVSPHAPHEPTAAPTLSGTAPAPAAPTPALAPGIPLDDIPPSSHAASASNGAAPPSASAIPDAFGADPNSMPTTPVRHFKSADTPPPSLEYDCNMQPKLLPRGGSSSLPAVQEDPHLRLPSSEDAALFGGGGNRGLGGMRGPANGGGHEEDSYYADSCLPLQGRVRGRAPPQTLEASRSSSVSESEARRQHQLPPSSLPLAIHHGRNMAPAGFTDLFKGVNSDTGEVAPEFPEGRVSTKGKKSKPSSHKTKADSKKKSSACECTIL